jgi:hypothetical protein
LRILAWLALGCAFGPVLLQLASTIPSTPFAWSVLLAPLLMIAAAAGDGAAGASRRSEGISTAGDRSSSIRRALAPALLALGLAIELVGIAGGSPGVARLGLPVAIVGLALWLGAPRARVALLAFWMIPIPFAVHALTSPNLESAYARIGAGIAAALGANVAASGPLLRSGAQHLELDPHDTGLHLALLAAELAWYAALRARVSWRAGVLRMACAALAALPLQLLVVLVAVVLLEAGKVDLAKFWLDDGAWLVVAVLGVTWIETRRAKAKRLGRV